MTYIIMSNGTWGRGESIEEAMSSYKFHGGTRRGHCLVIRSNDPEVTVTDWGGVSFNPKMGDGVTGPVTVYQGPFRGLKELVV